MKLIKSLLALAPVSLALVSPVAMAERIAISNAQVYTATQAGRLKNATVIIADGKIVALNPKVIKADKVIDAQGKILTPGFIAPMTSLGLIEVGAVAGSRDGKDKKAKASFDPSLAFNPKSSLIPYSRKGGITSSVVAPRGGESVFKGQAFAVDLTASFDSVRASSVALVVSIGAKKKGSRAMDIQSLSNALADAQHQQKNQKKKDKKLKPSDLAEQQLMLTVLAGETPLLVEVDRAADIIQLIKLKKQFGLNLVLQNVADAVMVAAQLAEAKVPVIVSAMDNLPEDFDSLHNALSNAGELQKAGVMVLLQNTDSHNMYQLRFDAGNAVANGMDSNAALKAITANVAKVFGLNSGEISVGKRADLVLWSADPFELSSHVETLWIDGQQYSTESRQDKLRQRYMSQSEMPKAYIK